MGTTDLIPAATVPDSTAHYQPTTEKDDFSNPQPHTIMRTSGKARTHPPKKNNGAARAENNPSQIFLHTSYPEQRSEARIFHPCTNSCCESVPHQPSQHSRNTSLFQATAWFDLTCQRKSWRKHFESFCCPPSFCCYEKFQYGNGRKCSCRSGATIKWHGVRNDS